MEIMEKKMETTTYDILGIYGDNGKENGNYYSALLQAEEQSPLLQDPGLGGVRV